MYVIPDIIGTDSVIELWNDTRDNLRFTSNLLLFDTINKIPLALFFFQNSNTVKCISRDFTKIYDE